MLNGRSDFRAGRATLSALAVLALLSGCAQPLNEPSVTGARDTGTYPNLNIKPGVANTQLSADQAAAMTGELNASLAGNRAARRQVPNDQAVLTDTARRHGPDTLRKIQSNKDCLDLYKAC